MCWSLNSATGSEEPHRLMADTCANIVFVRSGSFVEHGCVTLPGVHLAGPLSRHTDMIASAEFSVFGVYLWPWSAELLFTIPPATQLDAMIDLSTQWSPAEQVPYAGILTTDDPERSMQLLGDLLLHRVQGTAVDEAIRSVVQRLLTSEEFPGVEELAAEVSLARRQFERRFKTMTGLAPALFLRILRFQRCFRMLENGRADSLTGIAIEAGYFDQSHFIRDFKRFSGMNPRRYFRDTPHKADSFLQLE